MRDIRKVAVLGSGIMGGGIAALLAGVGIPVYMLDMVPNQLTDEEKAKGLTQEDSAVRNRIGNNNKQAILKSKPALLFAKDDANLIAVGNFDDNLGWLKEVDWVIEVIVENLEIKKQLLNKIAPYIKPDAVLSTNTSGISINAMAEVLPPYLKKNFLGTHFFNPVRYMNLFEIIPSKDTNADIISDMAEFGEKVLGKGIVYAQDTPNFVANRIGMYNIMTTNRLMTKYGFNVVEIDALTGDLIGKAKSATYKTIDMVGIDTSIAGSTTIYNNVQDPVEKEAFAPAPMLVKMANRGWLGLKTKGGFYKTVKTPEGKKQNMYLDLNTFEYIPVVKPDFEVVKQVKGIMNPNERIKQFIQSDDKVGKFIWDLTSDTLLYAASKIPEISDNILNIDNGICWGYNYSFGPFATWDAIGVEETVTRMEKEGLAVPSWVKEMLANGYKNFYQTIEGIPSYYCRKAKKYMPIPNPAENIQLSKLKQAGAIVMQNAHSTLIDMGDGVLCLEMNSLANLITPLVIEMLNRAMDIMMDQYVGLVITSAGPKFAGGTDVTYLLDIQANCDKSERHQRIKNIQDTFMRLKYYSKPSVAAPFSMCLGAGAELAMHASAIQAFAETNMGLVDIAMGLIPGNGGTKELMLRWMEKIPAGLKVNPQSFMEKSFENISQAKVSMSAKEAFKLGYLKPTDSISINKDHQLYDAKHKVLAMVAAGYNPPEPLAVASIGDKANFFAAGAYNMKVAGLISEYDYTIAKKIALIIAGGELIEGSSMSEEYLLGLERDAIIDLLDAELTQARIRHMMTTGKPLRN